MRYDADNDWVVVKPNASCSTYRVCKGKKLCGSLEELVVFRNWYKEICDGEADRLNEGLKARRRKEKPTQPPLFEETP